MSFPRTPPWIIAIPALVLLCWGPLPLAAQTPVSLRPTQYTNEGLTNPQNAKDTHAFTSAGGSGGRTCHSHYCTGPLSVARATWFDFPEAEGEPLELRVKWWARASGLIYCPEDQTEVRARIEYSLGGDWIELDSFARSSPHWCSSDPTCSYPTHEEVVALPSDLDTSVVQVRATLEGELVNCRQCTPIDSTNVAGVISIFDIRILAEP